MFRVQIIAVKRQLSTEELKKFYPESDDIVEWEDKSDGFYKYMIGNFQKYNEARNFKRSVRIRQAFVVAYKDGERILVREAKKLEQ
jgi:hypothetical protein